MKVPCRWLAEYVDIERSPAALERLAERLTLAGLEVEEVTRTGGLRGAVVGRVLERRDHPKSDHLSVCHVDIGAETLEVVCGAANVAVGQVVPVITVGGELPGGLRVEERKLRGVTSRGMICSKEELGLEPRSAGIWAFEEELGLEIGTDLGGLFEFDDVVFDLKITSNRPDCAGIYGVAREVAALTGRPLRPLSLDLEESDPPASSRFAVEIDKTTATLRYGARLMEGVRVGPSPLLVQHRLLKAGMRPLSNVVDATNYVMLELGHPLHPFDADVIRSPVSVRRARAGEVFRTLDGAERTLGEEVLLIADPDGGIAIAGVMGGERSEIRQATSRVLLEVAAFDPVAVRRAARALGMRTEASVRFERGVDPEAVPVVAARTAHLLKKLSGCDVRRGLLDAYPRPRRPQTIRLRPSRASALLGMDLDGKQISDVLGRLGMEVTADGDALSLKIPTFRADLEREVDLVEEVGRIVGYDRLLPVAPKGVLHLGVRDPLEETKDRVRALLVGLGLSEVVTDGFEKTSWREVLRLPEEDLVAVGNPMTAGQRLLRGALLPGILSVVEANLNQRRDGGMLFEVGRVFSKARGERDALAAAVFGRTGVPLSGKGEVGVGEAKGILFGLLSGLGVQDARVASDEVPPFLHPGRGGQVQVGGESVGLFGEVGAAVVSRLPAPLRVVVFELDLERLHALQGQRRVFAPLPRFPVAKRDLSLLIPAGLAEEAVRAAIAAEKEVEGILLYDLYQGGQVAAGEKSLTYDLSLRAKDRTLTDEETEAVLSRIEARLAGLGVRLRS